MRHISSQRSNGFLLSQKQRGEQISCETIFNSKEQCSLRCGQTTAISPSHHQEANSIRDAGIIRINNHQQTISQSTFIYIISTIHTNSVTRCEECWEGGDGE